MVIVPGTLSSFIVTFTSSSIFLSKFFTVLSKIPSVISVILSPATVYCLGEEISFEVSKPLAASTFIVFTSFGIFLTVITGLSL